MNTGLQDLRYCLRQLIKSPGFTLTAILSLTLGIGAATAVFSVVYPVLMDPYPYAASDRMVHMRLIDAAGHENGFGLTAGQWQTIRKSAVVENAFASDDWSLTVTGRDLPEDVRLSPPGDDTRVLIIGVVGDKRDNGLRNPILPEAFIPYTLTMRMWTQILVQSAGSPLALLHAIESRSRP